MLWTQKVQQERGTSLKNEGEAIDNYYYYSFHNVVECIAKINFYKSLPNK